jgi:hypothetical protein
MKGYQTVIAIATEPGELDRDLFQLEVIPNQYQQVPIHSIQPAQEWRTTEEI